MELSDIAEKIANNAKLTPHERDFWINSMKETQLRNAFLAGNINPQNQLNIQFPFRAIFSEVIEQDVAVLAVQIPGGYKHLMVWGQGRASAASGGTVWTQINGDTNSANYYDTYLQGDGTAASSGNQNFAQLPIGQFSNSGDPAGRAAQFDCRILNYASAWQKMALCQTYYNDDVTRGIYVFGGLWKGTAPISSMEIFATDNTAAKGTANIVAGSVFSIYGIQ